MSYLVNPVSWRAACILYWTMISSVNKYNYFYINLLHIQLSLFINFFFNRLSWTNFVRRKGIIVKKKYKSDFRKLLRSQKYYRTKFFVKLDVLFIVIYFFRKRRLKRRKKRWRKKGFALDWRRRRCRPKTKSKSLTWNKSSGANCLTLDKKIYPRWKNKERFTNSAREINLMNRRKLYWRYRTAIKRGKFATRRWRTEWKELKKLYINSINKTILGYPYPKRRYNLKVFLKKKRRKRLDNFFGNLMYRFKTIIKFIYKLKRFLILIYIKKILYFFVKRYFFTNAILFFFFYRRKLRAVSSKFILEYIRYRLAHKRENIPKVLRKLRLRLGIFWKKLFFGLKIVFSGRNRRRNRAIYISKQYGILPLGTKSTTLEYYTDSLINHFGVLTIKVWLYKSNV